MNEREAFEAWFNSEMPMESLITDQDNDYKYQPAIASWEAWQAALSQANVNEQSQAQQPEYTFDQLTKMMMQAATKEGHKVTMKIKWAQPPAPEGEKK